ncbi:hypothetical protein SLEP1_g12086 [Rubroshorea leprosula]|nr:hypothetical protein SLEP1_g12086 [Rubroshorea leprosula]
MAARFSPSEMSNTASTLLSAYASFTGTMMLFRSITRDFIPEPLRSHLYSLFHSLFTPLSSNLTLAIDEFAGMSRNEFYDAAELYLATKISPKTERLRLSKTQKQKNFTILIDKNEEVVDNFEGIQLKWKYVCMEPQNQSQFSREKRFFKLIFSKKFKDRVLQFYLPYVLLKAKQIKEESKVIKIYSRHCVHGDDDGDNMGIWGSMNLEHPATFDTIAMDPELKKMIIDDLERFVSRKEFYKKVGKAWKRGYLLYGPPGTGKSSLVAAMANYLKFDIYDLELASIYSDSDLKNVLLTTTNRSIIVIEDIDCSIQIQDRDMEGEFDGSFQKITLSGILNFIDGLWSSSGDERIIVFTTNHKDRLDPALLRPGRMDLHINLSYCTVDGFRILASNYLGIRNKEHPLFGEIDRLIQNTEVTPAEVAEELMRNEDVDLALEGLVKFIKRKRSEIEEGDVETEEAKSLKTGNEDKAIEIGNNRRGAVRMGRGRGRGRGRGMSSRGLRRSYPILARPPRY